MPRKKPAYLPELNQLTYPSRVINPATNEPFWREAFAGVYFISSAHGRYTKDPHIFYQLFIEENDLLGFSEIGLYRLHASRAARTDREKIPLNDELLAKKSKIEKETIVAMHDRLQDCFLIHKVCRLDLRGQPHDIIVHSPPTREQWNNGLGKRIKERVLTGETRIDRQARMKRQIINRRYNGEYREVETLVRDRANCCPPHFRVNFRQIFQSIGGTRKLQDEFVRTVLDVIFEMQQDPERPNLVHNDKEFKKAMARAFDFYEIVPTQFIWAAAFDLRRVYAPQIQLF